MCVGGGGGGCIAVWPVSAHKIRLPVSFDVEACCDNYLNL